MKILKNESAFTLLEIIIAIAIVGLVSGGFYIAYFDSSRAVRFNTQRIELQRNQDVIEEWISRYVKIADLSSASNNIKNISNSNAAVFYTIDGDKIEFSLVNESLNFSKNDNSYHQICDCTFNSIDFNFNSTLNFLEFKATISNGDISDNYTFSSVFYPRVQD